MIILGIDPGTATTGLGVIRGSKSKGFSCVDYTCIITKPTTPMPERVRAIFESLEKYLRKFKPDVVAMESLFFNTNPKTAMSVSRVSGVIMLTAALRNITFVEYTPLQVKSAITGYGKAEKMQVQKMLVQLLKLKEIPKPDDAADALAIALCAGVSL